MSEGGVSQLQAAIQAIRAGELDRARFLLTSLLQHEPENTAAWLWWSSALEGDDEKRRCLQRVLALDPENTAAQRGLAKLEHQSSVPAEKQTFRRELVPISPAAALLYPESQVREWQDEPLAEFRPVLAVEYQTDSAYDDVWTQDVDLCPYCAQRVEWDDERCPQCRRPLFEKRFRFPRPTADLYVLFVLLLGSGVVFSIPVLYDLLIQAPTLLVILHGLLSFSLLALSAAVYARQSWAYWVSLGILPLALLSALTSRVDAGLATRYLAASPVNPGLALIVDAIIGMAIAFIRPLQIMAAAFSLLYAIFRCGSDFIKVKVRTVAKVEPGLRVAADFYAAGRRYADRGRWAAAIMHWQRAAANEPNRAYYHRILGEAYDRLGFFRRSLDLLQSAHRLTVDPQGQAQLEALIAQIEQRLVTG